MATAKFRNVKGEHFSLAGKAVRGVPASLLIFSFVSVHLSSGFLRAAISAILLYGQSVSCFRLNTSKSTTNKENQNNQLFQSLR